MSTEIQHFIGGKFVPGRSGRTAPVFNPATGEQQGAVPLASAAEVDEAVALARAAFPAWAMTTPLRRARILNRFLRLLEENQERIAEVIVAEHGKVWSDALGEIARGTEVVEFATAAPHLLKGDITENVGTRVDSHSPAPAFGRRGRDHAVQLPGHGADVDVPGGAGLRQLLHPQGLRARAVGVPDPGRAAQGGRRAGRRVPGGARRQGGGRRHPAPIPASPRSASSARPRSRSTSTRPRPSTRSAARRWAGPRTT